MPAPIQPDQLTEECNTRFWTDVNVTGHAQFASVSASLNQVEWRNDQYIDYLVHMPLAGHDGKVILDYGCGPGVETVGLGHYSRPSRLIGIDISARSIGEAKQRLALHGIEAQLIQIDEECGALPLPDQSVDYINCSGVLHHAKDPAAVLSEFRRTIRPDGTCRIMVYNYDSIYLHLYVAYVRQIREGDLRDLDIRAAFKKTADGGNCPIARVYRPEEFRDLVEPCGFRCNFLGAALSAWEMTHFPLRFEAVVNPNLDAEHRRFLLDLKLDERGLPHYQDHLAGIDGCYELLPA